MVYSIPQVPDDHMTKHMQTQQFLARQDAILNFLSNFGSLSIICEGQMILKEQKLY